MRVGGGRLASTCVAALRAASDQLDFVGAWLDDVVKNTTALKWTASNIENQIVLCNTVAKSRALVKKCRDCAARRTDKVTPYITPATDRFPASGSRLIIARQNWRAYSTLWHWKGRLMAETTVTTARHGCHGT